jgi:hypothetical protein
MTAAEIASAMLFTELQIKGTAYTYENGCVTAAHCFEERHYLLLPGGEQRYLSEAEYLQMKKEKACE